MKLISLKCPECGATLDFEEDRSFIFCKYCGRKIYIEETNSDLIREKFKYKSLLAKNAHELAKKNQDLSNFIKVESFLLKIVFKYGIILLAIIVIWSILEKIHIL